MSLIDREESQGMEGREICRIEPVKGHHTNGPDTHSRETMGSFS